VTVGRGRRLNSVFTFVYVVMVVVIVMVIVECFYLCGVCAGAGGGRWKVDPAVCPALYWCVCVCE